MANWPDVLPQEVQNWCDLNSIQYWMTEEGNYWRFQVRNSAHTLAEISWPWVPSDFSLLKGQFRNWQALHHGKARSF